MGVELFAVAAVVAKTSANIDATRLAVADLVGIVEQTALVEAPHQRPAMGGVVVLAQHKGRHLAAR